MRDGWAERTLGAVVRRRTDFTPVEPDTQYEVLGVQRSGWGFVTRDPIKGRDQKFTKLMRLQRDDLVYRTITAFEAPSAVAGESEDGLFVTPQTFPVFTIDHRELLPAYMRLLTTWPKFHEEMSSRCTGTVLRRKTLSISAFQQIPVLLPPPDEQRRIVDLIRALDEALQSAEVSKTSASGAAASARALAFAQALEQGTERAEGVFEMLLGRQKSARQSVGDHVIPYVRAANIGETGLRLEDTQTMNFEPAEQVRYRLKSGDVLLVEGGSVGQSAIWNDELPGPVGFDKHVIRLRPVPTTSTTSFALHWTKWAKETGQFVRTATGATIKALGFGRASAMPVPALSVEEQDRLTEPLDSLEVVAAGVGESQERLRSLRSHLLTALLSGEHEIPASYDELLEGVSA